MSSARNAGLDIATGEYISFVDPDDWIHPQYFEILFDYLHSSTAHFSSCGFHIEHSYILHPIASKSDFHIEYLKNERLFNNHHAKTYVCGHLYRASMLRNHRFIESISISEDSLFNVTLFSKHDDINCIFINIPLYYYFQRSTSAIHSIPSIKQLDVCRQYILFAKQHFSSPSIHHCLLEAMKRCLSARYVPYILRDQKQINQCNILYKECLLLLLKNRHISLFGKIRFLILYLFPEIYRQFRIKDDPSMLNWEKCLISEQRKGY